MHQLKIEKQISEQLIEFLIIFLDKSDNLTNEDFLKKFQFHRRTIDRQIKNSTKISRKYFIPIFNYLYPACEKSELRKLIGEDVWFFVYGSPKKTRSTCIRLAPTSVQLNQVLARLFNEAEKGICFNEGRKKFGDAFLGIVSQMERYGLLVKSFSDERKWYSVDFKEDHPILFELWKSSFGK